MARPAGRRQLWQAGRWAPLVLAAAWHLTNRVYWKSTETGMSVQMNDGAVRLRRAEYLRSLGRAGLYSELYLLQARPYA